MSKLLRAITQPLPCRFISGDNGEPYLERYYLTTIFGWRFYLHRFIGSDPARGLHDHPWRRAFSVILSGGYTEQTRYGSREVRWFNYLTGDTFHRVVLFPATGDDGLEPCWTLFAHTAGDVKPWGFLRDPITPASYPQVDYKIFEPYKYPNGFAKKDWWKTAGNRKQTRAKASGL